MSPHLPDPLISLPSLLLVGVAAGCAGNSSANAPTAADTGLVTGTVAYRERMALPPDALVQVQLSDVSLQDVPTQVLAETTLSPGGRQVPLPFELRYDPAKIGPRRRYAVRATIRSEGQLLFTTDTHAPVLTGGHPSKVDLMLVRVTSPEGAAPDQLWGTSWLLEDIGGTGVIDNASPPPQARWACARRAALPHLEPRSRERKEPDQRPGRLLRLLHHPDEHRASLRRERPAGSGSSRL